MANITACIPSAEVCRPITVASQLRVDEPRDTDAPDVDAPLPAPLYSTAKS